MVSAYGGRNKFIPSECAEAFSPKEVSLTRLFYTINPTETPSKINFSLSTPFDDHGGKQKLYPLSYSLQSQLYDGDMLYVGDSDIVTLASASRSEAVLVKAMA